MPTVYLGLGSNLGNRALYIQRALERLEANRIHVKALSTVIETEPVGGVEQGKFLNAVARVETHHPPEFLHRITKAIEIKLGRRHKILNGPRVIDIDILLYDNIKLITPHLCIPHPRMTERDFVMKPLKEIAPDLCKSFLQ